jgi:hypothetical protein
VIRAVKEVLGHAEPAADVDDVQTILTVIEKLAERLIDHVQKLDVASADGVAAARVRELLGNAITRLGPRCGARP